MNSSMIGYFGERSAAAYLREKGYEIRAAGYRSRFGEIDIIAAKKGVIAFVEVKTRRGADFAAAREHVDAHKQRRIIATAEQYLASVRPKEQPRFDVAEVYVDERAGKLYVQHINYLENAFTL